MRLRFVQLGWQSWVVMIATVVIAWTAATNQAAVIVRDRQSAATARATTGIGCCAPTSDFQVDPKFTDANAPDFSPFSAPASASASVNFDNRPQGGQSFFSGSATATVSHNSQLTFNSTTNQLFGATFSALATATASGSGNILGTDSRASGDASFNLIFDVIDTSAIYTLSGSALGNIVSDDGELRLARVELPPGGFNRFPPTISRINVFDLANGAGEFNFSGQLDVGTYQLYATMAGRAGGLAGPPGSADFDLDLTFEEVIRDIHWIGPNNGTAPASGSFQVPGNWNSPIVPGDTDVAIFDLPGTYTVQLNQPVTNKRLQANGSGVNVSLDVNGKDYVLDEISVGGQDGDSVLVTFDDSSGVVVSAALAATGDGLVRAAANGAERRLRADLLKARKGGTADVRIPIETSRGTIDDGGRVNVKGANGLWDVFDLRVGEGGFAELFIENSAIVDAEIVRVGGFEGSSGYTEVSNGTLIQQGAQGVTVGGLGAATLAVKNKGLVDVEKLTIGELLPGNGKVTVDSLGELRVNGRLIVSPEGFGVGPGGIAELVINGGSAIQTVATGSTSISFRGRIEVHNGHFHEAHELKVNGTLALNRVNGSASVGNSSVKFLGVLSVGSEGTLKGNGIIRGKVRVLSNSTGTNQFVGQVLPGVSPGTLTIDGDYEQEGGLLGIEVAGTAAGQFDVLAVTGNALLGGELRLEFIDGFAPRQGDQFTFLDVGGALSGAFASVEIRNLAAGFQYDLRSDASGLTLVALNDGVFVPEPATLQMLLAGILAICFRRRAAVR